MDLYEMNHLIYLNIDILCSDKYIKVNSVSEKVEKFIDKGRAKCDVYDCFDNARNVICLCTYSYNLIGCYCQLHTDLYFNSKPPAQENIILTSKDIEYLRNVLTIRDII